MSEIKYASLTGFKNHQIKNMYKMYLEELGFCYSDTLLNQSTLLVAASVLTQKYKVYQIYRDIITCVKVQWLIDSHNANKCLETQQYQIRSQFYGACVGICGYQDKVTQKIEKIVSEKGGKLIKIANTNYRQIRLDREQNIEVLIIPHKIIHKFNIYQDQNIGYSKIPFVGLQWIEASIKSGYCRYPLDYAYNYLLVRPDRRQKQQTRLNFQLEKSLQQKMIQKLKKNQFEISHNLKEKEINQYLNDKEQKKNHFPNQTHKAQSTQIQENLQKKERKIIKPILISSLNSNKFKLDQMQEDESMFQGCFIYFHPQIQNSHILVAHYLKPLVCMKSGIYLDMICPAVTHIVVDKISQNQYLQLMKFGNSIPILRVQWVIDSILYNSSKNKRMKQADYFVRSFKENSYLQSKQDYIRQSSNTHNVSMSFKETKYKYLQQQFTPSQSTQYLSFSRTNSNHSSISVSMSLIHQPIVLKKKVSFKSTIFKNIQFYIPLKYRKQKQLKNIVTLIRQNGGVAYDKPKINKFMHCVMIDGADIQASYQQISKGYQQFLRPVSYRWVQYCVKRQTFFEPDQKNYFIFKPLKFKTPMFGFLVCKFQIVGVQDQLKIRIKQLLDEMGSKKSKPSIMEMTHCLCGKLVQEQQSKLQKQLSTPISPYYSQKMDENKEIQLRKTALARVSQIINLNARVKFIKLQWIFDCVSNGQMLPIEDYKLNNF